MAAPIDTTTQINEHQLRNGAFDDARRSQFRSSARAPRAGGSSSSTASAVESGVALASIEDFLLVSLGENAEGARADLLAAKQKLDENNAHQDLVRRLRSLARDGDASEVQDFINQHPELRGSDLLGEYADGDIDMEALREDIDAEMESLSGINSTLTFQLQVLATRATQAQTVRSAISKKFSDAADRIIGNI